MVQRRAPLLEIDPIHPEPHRVRQALEKIVSRRVVVYPTDTLYAFGADLESKTAVDQLYTLRKLDRRKPLSIICSALSEVARYARVDDDRFRVLRELLPGPYTFILPASRDVPRMGDARRRTVGVRVPDHPVAQALVQALGHPLLSTSALLSDGDGEEIAADPLALAEHLGDNGPVALVIDCGVVDANASSVIDWSEDAPVVLRAGAGDVSMF